MTFKLGVVMDPMQTVNFKKDSSIAMLSEAQKRNYELYYFELKDLFLRHSQAFGYSKKLRLHTEKTIKWQFYGEKTVPLEALDVLLMRKDPPLNEDYLYATYILEHAESNGLLVINHPQALRDANEKLFVINFPDCYPHMVVTQRKALLREFLEEYKDIVCKPLNAMGGTSIFRIKKEDVNANVIFEVLTKNETTFTMAQKYIPDITHGDKRILLINGEPFDYALARIPQGSDWRGNLAVGAKGQVMPLTERDKYICEQLQPKLKQLGLYFVGIDVIGDYLTEVNVTSPTGIKELDNELHTNISAKLFDFIELKLKKS